MARTSRKTAPALVPATLVDPTVVTAAIAELNTTGMPGNDAIDALLADLDMQELDAALTSMTPDDLETQRQAITEASTYAVPAGPEVTPTVHETPAAPKEVDAVAAFGLTLLGYADSLTPDVVAKMRETTTRAIDDRAAYEQAKHGGASNIDKTLANIRKHLDADEPARMLFATKVDPFVFSRSRGGANQYNVYAIQKVVDLLAALRGGKIANAINRAVLHSIHAFEKAGVGFTSEHAKDATSDKRRVADKKTLELLTRHNVSASTASTQASSTMQALETLGIVASSGGRQPSYRFTDTLAARRMKEILSV